MPETTKKYGTRGRPRTTAGKKQMLLLVPEDLVKSMKIAGIEDDRTTSDIAEEAMRAWLAKRKPGKT